MLSWAAGAIAAAVIAMPQSAILAATLDGNQLLELCAAQSPICTGYVMGIADAKDRDQHGITFCIPDGTSRTQLQDTVVAYLRKNTERRFPAHLLVSGALAEAYRCSG
jgi:hypothetical protein